MTGKSLYFAIAAVLAVFVGVVWCFTAGPCGGSTSAGDDPGTGVGGILSAASDAIQSAAQYATGNSNPLENEDNGIIFGGGA